MQKESQSKALQRDVLLGGGGGSSWMTNRESFRLVREGSGGAREAACGEGLPRGGRSNGAAPNGSEESIDVLSE